MRLCPPSARSIPTVPMRLTHPDVYQVKSYQPPGSGRKVRDMALSVRQRRKQGIGFSVTGLAKRSKANILGSDQVILLLK